MSTEDSLIYTLLICTENWLIRHPSVERHVIRSESSRIIAGDLGLRHQPSGFPNIPARVGLDILIE
jgi:hypothetical protein